MSFSSIKCSKATLFNLVDKIYEQYSANKFRIYIRKDQIKQAKSTEEVNKNGYYTTIIGCSLILEPENAYVNISDIEKDGINTFLVLGIDDRKNELYNIIHTDSYITAIEITALKTKVNTLAYKKKFIRFNEEYKRIELKRILEFDNDLKILDEAFNKDLEIKQAEFLAKLEENKAFHEKIVNYIDANLKINIIKEFKELDNKNKYEIIFRNINKNQLYDIYKDSIIYYFNTPYYKILNGNIHMTTYKVIIAIQTSTKTYYLNDIINTTTDKQIEIPCLAMNEKSKLVSYEYLIKLDEHIILSNAKKLTENTNECDNEITKLINDLSNIAKEEYNKLKQM